jgi:hypothetical protein
MAGCLIQAYHPQSVILTTNGRKNLRNDRNPKPFSIEVYQGESLNELLIPLRMDKQRCPNQKR